MLLGVKAADAYGWQPTTITVPMSRKLGALTRLDPSGPTWSVGTTLTFTLLQPVLMILPEDTTEISNGQSGQIPKLPTTSDFLPYSSFFPHHLNTEKYKTVQALKLHFLQNSSIFQIFTYASDCKGFRNIASLWKPFQLFRRIFNYVSYITKAPSLQCSFQSSVGVEIIWSQLGWSIAVILFFAHKSLTKTDLSEVESKSLFSIFPGFSFWPHPWGEEECQCTLLYSQ